MGIKKSALESLLRPINNFVSHLRVLYTLRIDTHKYFSTA